jgi:diaminopimelate epimerase
VSFRNRDIYVRTYERGVENETLSCGTGVVASALVVGKILSLTGGFKIKTRGGNLEVNLSPDLHDITLTGPAIKVFEGELDLNGGWAS